MAMRNEAPQSPSAAREQPLISHVTENGFTIIRLSEMKASFNDTAQEYCFVVRNPRGWEREVTVEFNEELIAMFESRRRNPLLTRSSFWLNCAERCLAAYLWEHDGYPPGGEITISELCADDVVLATHWRD